jgi:glycosyltransferase involved in cell wall biosynthesis
MQILCDLHPSPNGYTFVGSGGMATYVNNFVREIQIRSNVSLISKKDLDNFYEVNTAQQISIPVRHFLDGYNIVRDSRIGAVESDTFVTIHDLQDLYHPENFSAVELRKREDVYKFVTKNPVKLIAISKRTKSDLESKLGIDSKRIEVIYHGLDHFEQISKSQSSELVKIGASKFFYIPGKGWKHKGQLQLLNAICANINRVRKLGIKFVFACSPSDLGDTVSILLSKYKAQDVIIFSSNLSDEGHYNLHKKSMGVVLPSTFEGFGFSYAEALISNKVIFCFELDTYLELGRYESYFSDLFDYEALIASVIQFVIQGKHEIPVQIDVADIRARLTWKNCVDATIAFYSRET